MCAPRPVCSRPDQCREDRTDGIEPGHLVRNRDADLHRPAALFAVGARSIGLTGDAHEPAHALQKEIVTGARCIRSGLAETGDRAVDEARVDLGEARVVEAVLRQTADLEILDQHVGFRGQIAHQALALRLGDVDGDRLLAAVAAHEIGAEARVLRSRRNRERWSPAARVVAAAGTFDLDHFRAPCRPDTASPTARPGCATGRARGCAIAVPSCGISSRFTVLGMVATRICPAIVSGARTWNGALSRTATGPWEGRQEWHRTTRLRAKRPVSFTFRAAIQWV